MNSEKNRPLLICLTATRNYGWCTKAFLEANSSWADYIIVVDQMSTDNTRQLCGEYENVIVVDNKDSTYSETVRCTLAIDKAREIDGDKIFVYLAIDEILSADAVDSVGWGRMLSSNVSEVGLLRWANLRNDNGHILYSTPLMSNGLPFWMARIFHDDGITPYNNDGLDMHTHCIPYPNNAKEFFIDDFVILHLEGLNRQWSTDKQRFYQMIDFDKNHRSAITLDRMYSRIDTNQYVEVNKKWVNFTFDIMSSLDLEYNDFFDRQVLELITKNGVSRYRYLNVWSKEFIAKYNLKDPRNQKIKGIHHYLDVSRKAKSKNSIIVRLIDKVLKKVI